MASPDLTLIADIDFRKGSQKLNRQLRGIEKRGINIDTRKSQLALGRITGSVQDFDRSLAASNSRVIAFGASVAVIEGVRRSFVKLVDTIVQVEAQLTAINSILGRTSSNLQKFGNELFTIAKQTGQGFQQVAETAQEFARQGLSVEQTLARTKDALILQRLTTLKTEESVASLTAAINAFDKQALTSTQVINKLRAVETSFAVSSGDLADALARSASVAQDAGVSFDELLGVITAIKQRTGLGGATIGQGLKTVFTRLNLPTRIEQLRELGVTIDESAGGLEKLRQVSIAVGKAQEQGNVSLATQIGAIAAGQFQISKLSAAFSDLSSQYSVTDAAALKSASATNEAILANEEYNETIKSLANSVNQNIGQVLNKIGELGTQDVIKNFVKDLNSLLEAVQGNKAKAGTFLGEIVSTIALAAKEFGVLRAAAEGFANVLTGPGLVAAGSIIGNLFKNTLLQGGQSLLSLTGINNKTKRRAELQMGVNKLLDQATAAEMRNFNAAKNVAAQQQIILGILQRQVAARNSMANAPILGAIGARSRVGRQTRKFGTGDFAGGRLDPIAREQNSIKRGVGGATSNAEVRVIKEFNYGGGKVGPAVVNTDEVVIPSKKGDIVLNRDMMRGAKNFAQGLDSRDIERILSRDSSGKPLTDTQLKKLESTLGKERGFGSKIDNNTRARLQTARQNEIVRRTQKFQSKVSPTSSQGAFNSLVRREQEIAKNRGLEVARKRKVGEFMAPLRANPPLALPGSQQLALPGKTLEDERRERGTRKFKLEVSRRKAEISARNQQKRLVRQSRARDTISALDVERQRQSFQSGDPVKVDRLVKGQLFKEDVKSRLQAIREVNPEVDGDFLRNTSEGRELVRKTKQAAARDFRAQNETINKQIREQKLTQARKVLDEDSRGGVGKGRFGLRLPSLSRGENAALGTRGLDSAGKVQIRKEIQDRKFARGQRITQGAFIGSIAASFAAPGAGSLVEKASGSKRAGRATTGAISGAASGAALGALAGPKGLAIGAVVGGVGGLINGLKETGEETDELTKKIGELRENLRDTGNNVSSYIQFQSQLNALLDEGRGNTREANLLRFRTEEARKGFGPNAKRIIAQTQGSDIDDIVSKLQQALAEDTLVQEKELKNAEAQKKINDLQEKAVLQEVRLGRFFNKTSTIQVANSRSFGGESITTNRRTNLVRRAGFESPQLQEFTGLASNLVNPFKILEQFGGDLNEFQKEFSATVSQFDRSTENVAAVKAVFDNFGLDAKALPEDLTEASALGIIRGLNKFFTSQEFKEVFVPGTPKISEGGTFSKKSIADFNLRGPQRIEDITGDIPEGFTLDRDTGLVVPKKSSLPKGTVFDPQANKIIDNRGPEGIKQTTFDRDLGKFVPIGKPSFDRDRGQTEVSSESIILGLQKQGFLRPLDFASDKFTKPFGPQLLSKNALDATKPRLQDDDFFFNQLLPSTRPRGVDPSITQTGIERLKLPQEVFGPSVGSDTKIDRPNGDSQMVDTKTIETLEKLNTTLENFKQGDLGKIVQELTATYKFVLDLSSGGQITTGDTQELKDEMMAIIDKAIEKNNKRLKAELMGKPLPPEATV